MPKYILIASVFALLLSPMFADFARAEGPVPAENSLQLERQLLERASADEQQKKDIVSKAIEAPSDPPISWRFTKMPLDMFKTTLADQSIVLEMRNVPDSLKTVTINWTGADVGDALKTAFPFCSVDYRAYKYVVDCMVTRKIRLPLNYSVDAVNLSAAVEQSTSTGTTGTNGVTSSSQPQPQQNSAAKNSGDVTVTRNLDYYKNVMDEIKKLLSKQGSLSISQAGGFILVHDFAENVESVEKYVQSDTAAMEQVKFQVRLVRVTLNRGHEFGIDWNQVLSNSFLKNLTVNVTSTNLLSTNPVITAALGNGAWNVVAKAISTYGDLSVVHNWDVVAKGGASVTLKDVTDIPYISDVQTSQSTVSTIITPSFSSQEVGLKIVFDFTKDRDEVNINGVIDISSVLEYKQFTVSGFNVQRPSVMKNFVHFQSKAYLGESLIVSGFKVDQDDKQSQSIPAISKIPLIGWLFGHDQVAKLKDEYLVIITPVGVL